MSSDPGQLYEADFVRWTEQQAAALREAAAAGTNLPLDWENLAEEIDSLGRSQKLELRGRIATIIEHLLKLECSTASHPRRSWRETIARERINVEDLLADSPSLRNQAADMIASALPRTIRLVIHNLQDYGEANPETIGKLEAIEYTEQQVLGDWFPGDVADPVPPPANRERDRGRAALFSRGAF
jgi:hypothetical protein